MAEERPGELLRLVGFEADIAVRKDGNGFVLRIEAAGHQSIEERLTREQAQRLSAVMADGLATPAEDNPACWNCGRTGLVMTAVLSLLDSQTRKPVTECDVCHYARTVPWSKIRERVNRGEDPRA